MTSWHNQRNHNLQNYVYDNRNSFLVWKVFFLPEHLHRWPDSQILLTGNSKTKERITLVSLQPSEAVRLKMSQFRKKEQVAGTDSTNQHCNLTHLHLPSLTPFI